jgi:AbrB family looped-hinge helix DNA binding protein
MRTATKLTTKGQVVIPKAIRDRLRWQPGTRLNVETLSSGGVLLTAARASARGGADGDPIERAFGFLTHGDPVGDLEADHRAEIQADERRRRRR